MEAVLKLILGSGTKRAEGWISLDKLPSVNPDIVHDLSVYPWPIESDSVDEFNASHVLEHVVEQGKEEQFFAFFNELWRICKHGATGLIIIPDATKSGAFSDPGHKSFYSKDIFNFISKKSMASNKASGTSCTEYPLESDFNLVQVVQINEDIHCAVHVNKQES